MASTTTEGVENFVDALRPWGARREDIPMSFNIFMNSPVQVDGSFSIERPVSKAGDFIELRAEVDLIVALSNCPQDLNPCNAGAPKTLGWQLSGTPS